MCVCIVDSCVEYFFIQIQYIAILRGFYVP